MIFRRKRLPIRPIDTELAMEASRLLPAIIAGLVTLPTSDQEQAQHIGNLVGELAGAFVKWDNARGGES